MVKGRMVKVVKYLEKHPETTYREIAEAINETERAVRYDIEKINDQLSLGHFPEIKKHSKGILKVPKFLDFSVILGEDTFVFSSRERMEILRLLILFDTNRLNIRKMSEIFQVSRRSIQNDIEKIQKELECDQIYLEYEKMFYLREESQAGYKVRSKVFRNYIKILYKMGSSGAYEEYIKKALCEIFAPIRIEDVLLWIDNIIHKAGWIFSDQSFQWYVANVCIFTWYLIRDRELPAWDWEKTGEIGNTIEEYEVCIGKTLSPKQREILSGFEKYTNKYSHLDVTSNLMNIDDMTEMLIRQMQEQLNVDFGQDGILMKGLLNHLGPMVDRIRGDVQLHDNVEGFIPDDYGYVYDCLQQILKGNALLSQLTSNEIMYLAIYFIGSIRRMKRNSYKNVLLICGFGYGTTAMVKDALLNRYQIFVKKSLSAYQVQKFRNWEDIDVVISTVDVELPVEKPFVRVNVIFNESDYIKLDLLGLQKKNVLTNYFAIERKLDFLDDVQKHKVMEIIREELGYTQVRIPGKYSTLSDLIGESDIRCVSNIPSWKQAVKECTELLKCHGNDGDQYCENIIEGIDVRGFYSVTDHEFALLHGSENAGIQVSGMSLVISEEPVKFGNKEVNVIFCLASRDKKEHIPVITKLMRMVSKTDFIRRLEKCKSSFQAMELIRSCEKEVNDGTNN